MLGDLLEFSISAEPLGAVTDYYRKLGFREAEAGNIVEDAYVPLCHDRVAVGLRPSGHDDLVPTFVRPDLKNHLRGFKRLGLPLEFAETADDQFHRAGFRDPNDLLVILLEARTSSPPPDAGVVSPLGEFLELSAPAASLTETVAFWEQLGVHAIDGGEAPQPWRRLAGHGLTLGCYAGRRFKPGLSFACDNAAARIAYLVAQGCNVTPDGAFALPDRQVWRLAGPAHPIYLVAQ